MRRLFIVLMLTGCTTGNGPQPRPQPSPQPGPGSPASEMPPLPDSSKDILHLKKVGSTQGSEEAMVKKGFEYANQVLKSECFRNKLATTALTRTQGRDFAEVYRSLTAPELHLEVYFFTGNVFENYWFRTVGREYTNRPEQVFMNRFFVKTARQVADNLLHEAAHSRGYRHRKASEWSSVPYTMNALFRECATDAMKLADAHLEALTNIPYHPDEE